MNPTDLDFYKPHKLSEYSNDYNNINLTLYIIIVLLCIVIHYLFNTKTKLQKDIENLKKQIEDSSVKLKTLENFKKIQNNSIQSYSNDLQLYMNENISIKSKLEENNKTLKEYKRIADKYNAIFDFILYRFIGTFDRFIRSGNSGTFSTDRSDEAYNTILSYMLEKKLFYFNSSALKCSGSSNFESNRNEYFYYLYNNPLYKDRYIDINTERYGKIISDNLYEVIFNKKEYVKPY